LEILHGNPEIILQPDPSFNIQTVPQRNTHAGEGLRFMKYNRNIALILKLCYYVRRPETEKRRQIGQARCRISICGFGKQKISPALQSKLPNLCPSFVSVSLLLLQ
jgi:hypothetical protein